MVEEAMTGLNEFTANPARDDFLCRHLPVFVIFVANDPEDLVFEGGQLVEIVFLLRKAKEIKETDGGAFFLFGQVRQGMVIFKNRKLIPPFQELTSRFVFEIGEDKVLPLASF